MRRGRISWTLWFHEILYFVALLLLFFRRRDSFVKRLLVAAAFVGARLFSPYEETLAASVSQGVYHDSKSTGNGTVHELSVNLNQPYTTVDLGLPRPITKRTTV